MNEKIAIFSQALANAKEEYTTILVEYIRPAMFEGFLSIYEVAMEVSVKERKEDQVLYFFQRGLSLIRSWSPERVVPEYERIKEVSGCPYLEDVITIVFVCFAKTLALVKRVNGPRDKLVDLEVPTGPSFIHHCYIESARLIWSKAYLFYHAVPAVERQNNISQIMSLLREGIIMAVQHNLPIASIIRDYIGNTAEIDRRRRRRESSCSSSSSSSSLSSSSNIEDAIKESQDIASTSTQENKVEEEKHEYTLQKEEQRAPDKVFVMQPPPKRRRRTTTSSASSGGAQRPPPDVEMLLKPASESPSPPAVILLPKIRTAPASSTTPWHPAPNSVPDVPPLEIPLPPPPPPINIEHSTTAADGSSGEQEETMAIGAEQDTRQEENDVDVTRDLVEPDPARTLEEKQHLLGVFCERSSLSTSSSSSPPPVHQTAEEEDTYEVKSPNPSITTMTLFEDAASL